MIFNLTNGVTDKLKAMCLRRNLLKEIFGVKLDKIPFKTMTEKMICDDIIGYVRYPVCVAGPVKINDQKKKHISISTSDMSHINRGFKVIDEACSGVTVVAVPSSKTEYNVTAHVSIPMLNTPDHKIDPASNAANVISAIFLCTGHDICNVDKNCITTTEYNVETKLLRFGIQLPCLEIGRSLHEDNGAVLEAMGIKNNMQLAEIVGATVLAHELNSATTLAEKVNMCI